ncbi:MAG: hypothetical protein ACUVQR_11030 [Thermogutta sp.]
MDRVSLGGAFGSVVRAAAESLVSAIQSGLELDRTSARGDYWLFPRNITSHAEFPAQSHVDGTVVMAVSHHGYCTHNTKAGERFPSLTFDWFGAMIDELHRRGISAFGYVTLNWNWKDIREHLGADFIHGEPDENGVCGNRVMLCLNAPGYLDLVEPYTAEVMSQYAIYGMRWDILKTVGGCRCSGWQTLYRELFGEPLAADKPLLED